MKIIHCADIHLDSNLGTNFDKSTAATRRNELLLTFVDMVKFAISAEVKAIIIAGDLFDCEEVLPRTRDVVINCIEKNPQIDFLYISGNHDEAAFLRKLDWLPNLKLLDDNVSAVRYDNIVISGSLSYNFNKDDFNIVVLHGEINSFGKLQNRNIDYFAMGHIHKHMVGKVDERGEYCYPGCLEARGFDECGKSGFVVLDINGNFAKKEFIRFGKRSAHLLKVDVSSVTSTSELIELLEMKLSGIPHKDMVKIVLEGETAIDFNVDFGYLKQYFSDVYFAIRIEDATSTKFDLQLAKDEYSLRGEFIRTVLCADEPEELKKQIIRCGLGALSGEVTKQWL